MYPDLTLKERVTHGTSKNPLMALHFSAGPETLYPTVSSRRATGTLT